MRFKHIQNLDKAKDIIIPCKKGKLMPLAEFTSLKNLDFEGEFSTYQLVYGASGDRIYLLGLGEEKDAIKTEEAFRKLAFDTKKNWTKSIQVYAELLSDEEITQAVIGLELSNYEMGQFKSEQKKRS